MRRLGKSTITALIGACVALAARPSAAADFNVYYRANASSPWVFYAGKGTQAAADATVADLQSTGYSAQVVTGQPAQTAGVVQSGVTTPSVVVNRTTTAPYGPAYSNSLVSSWGGGSSGYSYGGGAWYGGGGGFRNADNWHHHDHSHEHSHEGHHDAHNANHHPTNHPHQGAAGHHEHTGAHSGAHAGAHGGAHGGGAHHGSHHGHSHSHSHSHSHHGGKK